VRRKLVKRIEDLIDQSSALKDSAFPKLHQLNNKVSIAVDFGIQAGTPSPLFYMMKLIIFFQLAQQVGQYIGDVRGAKETFRVSNIILFVREIVHSTVSNGRADGTGSIWNGIVDTLMQLVQESGSVVPAAMEPENVIKSRSSPVVDR
jgi:dynactin 1